MAIQAWDGLQLTSDVSPSSFTASSVVFDKVRLSMLVVFSVESFDRRAGTTTESRTYRSSSFFSTLTSSLTVMTSSKESSGRPSEPEVILTGVRRPDFPLDRVLAVGVEEEATLSAFEL